jgi:hypothetical protein
MSRFGLVNCLVNCLVGMGCDGVSIIADFVMM